MSTSTSSGREQGTVAESTPPARGLSRRSLAQGAAWSVPVIAVAAAAPAVSASTCVPTTTTWVPIEPAGGSTLVGGAVTSRLPGLSSTQYDFTVNVDPACPITYEVQGGQGARLHANEGAVGAGGARITGTITLSTGGTSQLLTIVAGSGGRSGSVTSTASATASNSGVAPTNLLGVTAFPAT